MYLHVFSGVARFGLCDDLAESATGRRLFPVPLRQLGGKPLSENLEVTNPFLDRSQMPVCDREHMRTRCARLATAPINSPVMISLN
jgi:hypothetical protein